MPAIDPTFIVVDLPTQAEGILPDANLPLATADVPGIVQPDGVTIVTDSLTGIISTLGYTGTIITGPLSPVGTTGSMTYKNGVLLSQVAAT